MGRVDKLSWEQYEAIVPSVCSPLLAPLSSSRTFVRDDTMRFSEQTIVSGLKNIYRILSVKVIKKFCVKLLVVKISRKLNE